MKDTKRIYVQHLISRSLLFAGLLVLVLVAPEQTWQDFQAGPVRITPILGF